MARRGPLGQRGRLEPARGSPPSCAFSQERTRTRRGGRKPSPGAREALSVVLGALPATRSAGARSRTPSLESRRLRGQLQRKPRPRGRAAPPVADAWPLSARKSPPWGSSSQRASSKVSARAQLWRHSLFSPGGDHLRRCLPSAERSPWLPSFSSSGVSTSALPCGMRGTVTVPTTATLADVPVTKRRRLASLGMSANMDT